MLDNQFIPKDISLDIIKDREIKNAESLNSSKYSNF